MSLLSSEDRYVLMGREVTAEVAHGEFRNGWALGYELGGPGRILVVWARNRGEYEASWVWPDQVLQATGDHVLDKIRDHDYTGADQAAFERIYSAAMAVADEPDPVAHTATGQAESVPLPVPAWGPTWRDLAVCGVIALLIAAILVAGLLYPGW